MYVYDWRKQRVYVIGVDSACHWCVESACMCVFGADSACMTLVLTLRVCM